VELKDERIAWLNILLSVNLWNKGNFSAIASKFGKVLAPMEFSLAVRDLSVGKVCVLTKAKTFINEDVEVCCMGKNFKVGVMEVADGRSPFGHNPHLDVYNDSDEEMDDDDGISNTVFDNGSEAEVDEEIIGRRPQERCEDMEEGEIREETGDEVETVEETMLEGSVGDVAGKTIDESSTPAEDGQADEMGITPTESVRIPEKDFNSKTAFVFNAKVGQGTHVHACEDQSGIVPPLEPSGPQCIDFGPPLGRRILPPSFFTRPIIEDGSGSSSEADTDPKKRRTESPIPSIDLNRSISPSRSMNSSSALSPTSNVLLEMQQTIEIGALIGVEIEADNAILKEAMGETGEIIIPQ